MAHDVAMKILEDVGRRRGLGEIVISVDLADEHVKHKMASSASLMHKVNTQFDILSMPAASYLLVPSLQTRQHTSHCQRRLESVPSQDSQD